MILVKPHYIKLFGEELGEWMVENFSEVNEQTLPLVNHLAKHHSLHAKALTYLALCINLEAKDIEDYVSVTLSIVKIKAIRLVNEA
jgi:predicted MarR family transcription regulator